MKVGEEMKIIIAGDGEYGLGGALRRRWPEAKFCSRKTGYDLCQPEQWARLAEESLSFDVFISCSSLWRFHQSLLIAKVWETWKSQRKRGQMIHMGSTADTGLRGGTWMYPVEKSALKVLSRNLAYSAVGDGEIRSTLLSPGYLNTPKVESKHPERKKIDPEYIVDIIDWLIRQPPHININEISLDPVQARTP